MSTVSLEEKTDSRGFREKVRQHVTQGLDRGWPGVW